MHRRFYYSVADCVDSLLLRDLLSLLLRIADAAPGVLFNHVECGNGAAGRVSDGNWTVFADILANELVARVILCDIIALFFLVLLCVPLSPLSRSLLHTRQ
jgi:hypothetical protein